MTTDSKTTPELFDLTGHVAVITGGGRGIGEGMLDKQTECTFMWSTKVGDPVGVVMNFVYDDGARPLARPLPSSERQPRYRSSTLAVTCATASSSASP